MSMRAIKRIIWPEKAKCPACGKMVKFRWGRKQKCPKCGGDAVVWDNRKPG